MLEKTVNVWEYKVDNNVYKAIFVRLWKIRCTGTTKAKLATLAFLCCREFVKTFIDFLITWPALRGRKTPLDYWPSETQSAPYTTETWRTGLTRHVNRNHFTQEKFENRNHKLFMQAAKYWPGCWSYSADRLRRCKVLFLSSRRQLKVLS